MPEFDRHHSVSTANDVDRRVNPALPPSDDDLDEARRLLGWDNGATTELGDQAEAAAKRSKR